jgi:hypothetical protein
LGLGVTALSAQGLTEDSSFTHNRVNANGNGQVGVDTYFGEDEAPKCFYDPASGRTYVHYDTDIQPSFKCWHVDGAGFEATDLSAATHCTCTATHPTHHYGACMEFKHVTGTNMQIHGTCTDAGTPPPAPTTTQIPPEPTCDPGYYANAGQCTKMRLFSSVKKYYTNALNGNEPMNKPGLDSSGMGPAWCAKAGAKWAIRDLGSQMSVTGVVTQRRGDNDSQYVKTLTISVSLDGVSWADVDGGNTFTANDTTESRDYKKFINFAAPVTARYVRINPKTFAGTCCMRAGVVVAGEANPLNFLPAVDGEGVSYF